VSRWSVAAIVVYALGSLCGLHAAELSVRTEDSILAVITHKAGFAAGLAHDHLVAAGTYDAKLAFESDSLSTTRFELRLRCEDLVVDDPALRRTWFPRLQEIGILEEPFGEVADADRVKIREAMLGRKQLDGEAHPVISATLLSVREAGDDSADDTFPLRVNLALEVHGQRVERELQARYTVEGDRLLVESFGAFLFSDFGIKPYSAFLGAVRNEDRFHVYVRLEATGPLERRDTPVAP